MDRKEMIKQKIKEDKVLAYTERLNTLQEHLYVIEDYIRKKNNENGYDRCNAKGRMFRLNFADTEKALEDKIGEIKSELIEIMLREITDAEYEEQKDLYEPDCEEPYE